MTLRTLSRALLLSAVSLPLLPSQPAPAPFTPPGDALIVGLRETATHRTADPTLTVPTHDGRDEDLVAWLHVDPGGFVTAVRPAGSSRVSQSELETQARLLHYIPFQRNGHPAEAWVQEYFRLRVAERLPARQVTFPTVSPSTPLLIELSRSGCYGSCPGYKVTVDENGRVTFTGKSFVSIPGTQHGQITPGQVRTLLDRFRAADFFSLDPEYVAAVTDNPTYRLKLTLGGNTMEVTDYVGAWVGMPRAVAQLEDAIDQITDSARWVRSSPATVVAMQQAGIAAGSLEGTRILQAAVSAGDVVTARALLQAGTPVRYNPPPDQKRAWFESHGDSSLLLLAIEAYDHTHRSEMLRTLLYSPAVRPTHQEKQDALGKVAGEGEADLAQLLIAAGADPTARFEETYGDDSQLTYLMAAAGSGVWAMLDDALARPHDFTATDKDGRTALLHVLYSAPQAEDIFPLLDRFLAAGAPKSQLDQALLDTCQPDRIVGLVARGANPNARDAKGNTPLFQACTVRGVRTLLDAGTDPALRNLAGQTATEATYPPNKDGEDPRAALIRTYVRKP